MSQTGSSQLRTLNWGSEVHTVGAKITWCERALFKCPTREYNIIITKTSQTVLQVLWTKSALGMRMTTTTGNFLHFIKKESSKITYEKSWKPENQLLSSYLLFGFQINLVNCPILRYRLWNHSIVLKIKNVNKLYSIIIDRSCLIVKNTCSIL